MDILGSEVNTCFETIGVSARRRLFLDCALIIRIVNADTSRATISDGGNSSGGEARYDGLTQGDAAIITGYLPVGKNLETTVFQQCHRPSQQEAILKYAAT